VIGAFTDVFVGGGHLSIKVQKIFQPLLGIAFVVLYLASKTAERDT
jgi:hypothetical protein